MRISPITISTNYKMNSFKSAEKQPKQTESPKIEYSTWGDNYAYPVSTNTEIKDETKNNKEIIEKKPESNHQYDETPEEYYRRKLYSTEWTM